MWHPPQWDPSHWITLQERSSLPYPSQKPEALNPKLAAAPAACSSSHHHQQLHLAYPVSLTTTGVKELTRYLPSTVRVGSTASAAFHAYVPAPSDAATNASADSDREAARVDRLGQPHYRHNSSVLAAAGNTATRETVATLSDGTPSTSASSFAVPNTAATSTSTISPSSAPPSASQPPHPSRSSVSQWWSPYPWMSKRQGEAAGDIGYGAAAGAYEKFHASRPGQFATQRADWEANNVRMFSLPGCPLMYPSTSASLPAGANGGIFALHQSRGAGSGGGSGSGAPRMTAHYAQRGKTRK